MITKQVCNVCGGALIQHGIGRLKCDFCGNIFEEAVGSSEESIRLVNAYEKLRTGELEDAIKSFTSILDTFPKSYEAWFGLALAEHGIVYVEDNRNGKKRVPTCYDPTLKPFQDSSSYKKALEYAPVDIRERYQSNAQEIDRIREYWSSVVSKEKKYDIFISFKDSDDDTNERTADSVEVQDIYSALKDQGYNVFYSRLSLRDKIAENYEPYIYHALQTADIMIVYGQKAEYFNSKWIRNEWTRWWKMIDSGSKHQQSLVVAYEKIGAYDIPKNLLRNGMMALDASRKDFLDALKGHIEKVIDSIRSKSTNVRVELAGYTGKKATKIQVEKITKKQLGSGIKRSNNVFTGDAISVREISSLVASKPLVEDTRKLSVGNTALRNGRFSKALKCYSEVLENGHNVPANFGCLLASVEAKEDNDFVERSHLLLNFSYYDAILSNCSNEELERVTDLFYKAERRCFDKGYIVAGIRYFEKLVAYNVSIRENAIKVASDAISRYMAQPRVNLDKLCEVYIKALTNEDVDQYIKHCCNIIDSAFINKRFALANRINEKIGQIDKNIDVYIYNQLRCSTQNALINIYKLPDFSIVDHLLSNVSTQNAKIFNTIMNNAIYCGLNHLYNFQGGLFKFFNKNIVKLKNKVIELFKIVTSYSFEYDIDDDISQKTDMSDADFFHSMMDNGKSEEMDANSILESLKKVLGDDNSQTSNTLEEDEKNKKVANSKVKSNDAVFKFDFFIKLLNKNIVKQHYSNEEISQLKKYILSTLDEDSVDEYVAYEIAEAVYNMRIKKFDCARVSLASALEYIPNDATARILDLCCTYKVTENDIINAKGGSNVVVEGSNAVVNALIRKVISQKENDFDKQVADILRFCKKQPDWRHDSQSNFYIDNLTDEYLEVYYKYFNDVKLKTSKKTDSDKLAGQNVNYVYNPVTQYDYVIKVITDEIINMVNGGADEFSNAITRKNNKFNIEKLANVYYNLLKYIDANNKSFMCERLKLMGDELLNRKYFDLAEKFYSYAISEVKIESELYWKRLHARYKAVNTVELILSKKKIEDDIDYNATIELIADDDVRNKYMQVPNKQEYLMGNRKLKDLLKKKKDFIPSQDIERLFVMSDSNFKKYLQDLNAKEEQRKTEYREKRNKQKANKRRIRQNRYKKIIRVLSYIALSILAMIPNVLAVVIVTKWLNPLFDYFMTRSLTFSLPNIIAMVAIIVGSVIVQIKKLIDHADKSEIINTIIMNLLLVVLVTFVQIMQINHNELYKAFSHWGCAITILIILIEFIRENWADDLLIENLDIWLRGLTAIGCVVAFMFSPLLFETLTGGFVQFILVAVMVVGSIVTHLSDRDESFWWAFNFGGIGLIFGIGFVWELIVRIAQNIFG